MDGAEGKLSGAGSVTSLVSGEASVRLQSELVMGERVVGENVEGPLFSDMVVLGGERDCKELLRLRKVLLLEDGGSM